MNTTTTASTTASPATQTRWTLDPGHSAVGFSVRHLMITNVRGEFEKFTATVVYDRAHPEATRIDARIDVASINTREPKRDADLRSELFFDAEHHPEMIFVSKGARVIEGADLELTGDLTIRGITREVTLTVSEVSPATVDLRGNTRMGATASTKIKRSDFGMTWNKALETGGLVVGDVVTISLEVSLVKAA